MLSQNVAKTTVPSYYMIRTNLPHRKPQNQWEGVYYYSGITKRQQHTILLQRKRTREAHLRRFNIVSAELQQKWEAVQHSETPLPPAEQYELAFRLAQYGLHEPASQCVDLLHSQRQLQVGQYALLIGALSADRVGERILHGDAMCDPAMTFKYLGDASGEARASEAYRWYDMGMSILAKESLPKGKAPERTAAASHLTNALMSVLLTCGYTHVSAVPNALYDRMGIHGISPTISTYEMIMLALSLQGNTREAESVMSFLRHHHSEHITIRGYNALLLGHREEKAFDQCDALWQELVDRRWPRANATTAELYLRSIVDHSYTPVSEPLQRFGHVNVVEKKKIPVILSQMDGLGIPRTHLSRPLMDEVEDALRKFCIYKNRFYEWGRAVKQFDFIEFRRRHGWMYDLHLMKNTTKILPPLRDPSQPDATMAGIAMAEIPAFFSERQPWEGQALESVLNITHERERTDDVRGGDIYYDETKSVNERSATWFNEVPETRYDQLYGVNHPDIAKVGIRRHLNAEYTNRKEVLERDTALMKKSVSSGRRVRHRVEGARTHRNEGSLTREKSK